MIIVKILSVYNLKMQCYHGIIYLGRQQTKGRRTDFFFLLVFNHMACQQGCGEVCRGEHPKFFFLLPTTILKYTQIIFVMRRH